MTNPDPEEGPRLLRGGGGSIVRGPARPSPPPSPGKTVRVCAGGGGVVDVVQTVVDTW